VQPALLQIWYFNSELRLNLPAFCYQGFGLSKKTKKTKKQENSSKLYFPYLWFVRGMF